MPIQPRQFRLADDTLADLDRIAAHLRQTTGLRASRADAVRLAAREYAGRLAPRGEKKIPKKS